MRKENELFIESLIEMEKQSLIEQPKQKNKTKNKKTKERDLTKRY